MNDFDPSMILSPSHLKRDDLEFDLEEEVSKKRAKTDSTVQISKRS